MGDAPADVAATSFGALRALRDRLGRPPPRYEDITALLLAAIAKASRDIGPRRHCKLEGLVATFGEGVPEIRLVLGVVAIPNDELAIARDLFHKIAATYRDAVDRRPTMREALAAAAFVLRPVPSSHLDPEETRELDHFQAVYADERGLLSAEEILAMVAAAMRRNERRLGLLAWGGEAMQPIEIQATTHDGRELRAPCSTAQAPTELVDDACARLDGIASENSKEPLSLERLMNTLLETFQQAPERFAGLSALRLVTKPRAADGRPSASARAGQAEAPPGEIIRVRHTKFGAGTVRRTIDDGQKKYEIAFDSGPPLRTLLARFVEELGPPSP